MANLKRILWIILTVIMLLIGLGLLLALGYGVYFLFKTIWTTFFSVNNQYAMTLITVSITVIVSVIAVVIGKNTDKKREIQQQQRTQKIEFYQHFLGKWFELLDKFPKEKGIDKKTQDELKKFVIESTPKLILLAGKDVIREYIEFRNFSKLPAEQGDYDLLIQFEYLLFEMRKELGHSNKGLEQLDLLSLYINDIETIRSSLDTSVNKK